jgi:hypothetical protein
MGPHADAGGRTKWSMLAKYPGTCTQCRKPIVALEHRIRPSGGGWKHDDYSDCGPRPKR